MKKRIDYSLIIFILIILLAAYFRLYEINLAEFKGDEARDSFIAKDLALNGTVPLVGAPLTVGGNSGPIYYFILAIPFFFSQNPIVASAFVAVLNVIGVIITYKFAKEFFNQRIALITAAFVAVSPFAILFSRKIWNPDLLFPFLSILIYSFYSFIEKKNSKFLIPLSISFAILLQLHAITIFLLPAILIFLFKSRSSINLKYFGIAIACFLILFSPFIYFEATNNFKNIKSFISTSGFFYFNKINTIAIQHLAAVTSGTDFNYILGDSSEAFFSSVHNVNKFFALDNLLLLFGSALIFYFALTNFKKNLKYSILFLWMVIPTIILLFFTASLYPYHLLLLYPVNFLIVAILLDFLFVQATKFTAQKQIEIFIFAILFIVLSSQIIFDQGFLNFLGTYGGTSGLYEVGVQYKIDLTKYIAQNSDQNFTISYFLTKNEIGVEYNYLLNMFGKSPSDSATLRYIVTNNLSNNQQQSLSNYQHVNFGPLTLYVLHQ